MIKIRFNDIGPHKHNWLSEVPDWDGELLIKEIKRRRFCPECGESYAGHTNCAECETELVNAWPYRTPPDIWYDSVRGTVWLGGVEPRGTFEVVGVIQTLKTS